MKNLKRYFSVFVGLLALLMVVGLQSDVNAQQNHPYWVKYEVEKSSYDAVAPNFPKPESLVGKSAANHEYVEAFDRWTLLYSHEYVAFFNQMEKSNVPVYYAFVHANIGENEPVMENTGDAYSDEINYQLRLQKWTYLNQPEQFMSSFGFQPDVSPSAVKAAETWDFSRTK